MDSQFYGGLAATSPPVITPTRGALSDQADLGQYRLHALGGVSADALATVEDLRDSGQWDPT